MCSSDLINLFKIDGFGFTESKVKGRGSRMCRHYKAIVMQRYIEGLGFLSVTSSGTIMQNERKNLVADPHSTHSFNAA